MAMLAYSLLIKIDAQISVKLTHTPLVGGGAARRRCFAHSVAGQLQKISLCKLYGMCVRFILTKIYSCNDQKCLHIFFE